MTLYRAIDRSEYQPNKIYYPYPTKRLPSNIPYVVDNLWEWARPSEYPSRRHAAYASPCPEQARKSSISSSPVVCRLKWHGENKVAQHRVVVDAKQHADVKFLPKLLLRILGKEWASLSVQDKGLEGLLWVPGLDAAEVQSILETSAFGNHVDELKGAINFWKETDILNCDYIANDFNGELFFEYSGGYSLQSISD